MEPDSTTATPLPDPHVLHAPAAATPAWLTADGSWSSNLGIDHASPGGVGQLERRFDIVFTAAQALREKQVQQNYRPVIGVHKWFARRPGTLFRNLLLAEFAGERSDTAFFRAHRLRGVIADPFMGGGTPLIEANRLGFAVVGADINPMAYWIVRQELGALDDQDFAATAEEIAIEVDASIGSLYQTECLRCRHPATVKYFLWVKTQSCPACGTANDLFPGYLLAEAVRHPKYVVACADCGALVELEKLPQAGTIVPCPDCGGGLHVEGTAKGNKVACQGCHHVFKYPVPTAGPPQHRMWAIEYHCAYCKPHYAGRFFKVPGSDDLARMAAATRALAASNLAIPDQAIPEGDETTRLHRWGYQRYREMFNARQLFSLGLLQKRIDGVPGAQVRHALLTVFSDILRYQNMLCRYDTYALKCQDIFSVHGFPVGLVQCENNLLGIPDVGSGGFRHFIAKYRRAKAYCRQPFETRQLGSRKQTLSVVGETIAANFVLTVPTGDGRQAYLQAASATDICLPPNSLDGVFTDPPYFANVQYAELIDFCYVWLRQSLVGEFPQFAPLTTRAAEELTGNVTTGKGLAYFTEGLSRVFCRFAAALKPGAPFAFTYHHNDITAYAPLVVALLDADLLCTAVLPAPAEMGASLHINNTRSSILDSVFVARRAPFSACTLPTREDLIRLLVEEGRLLAEGGVHVTVGDTRCLLSGHLARLVVVQLTPAWDKTASIDARLATVQAALKGLGDQYGITDIVNHVVADGEAGRTRQLRLLERRTH